MNTRFLLPLACAAGLAVAVPAHARDDAARNMILGGVAGAIIGNNNHHQAAEGAIIGATAGLLLTAITEENRYDRGEVYYAEPPRCRDTVVITRPYCPPARSVVVVRPAPYWYHSRAAVERRDRREDHREARHDRREDRRDDRRDARHDRYAYNR